MINTIKKLPNKRPARFISLWLSRTGYFSSADFPEGMATPEIFEIVSS
jgi:hypothetical protein